MTVDSTRWNVEWHAFTRPSEAWRDRDNRSRPRVGMFAAGLPCLHAEGLGTVICETLLGQRHFSLMIASISGVANWVYDRTMELPFQ
jgi:hypothetical protein